MSWFKKIQNIGTDPKSVAVIDKITQLLNDVGVGGRVQSLLARVEKIDDNDVQKAVNKIAKMVSTVDFDTAGREKLFKLWNADKIVNKKVYSNQMRVYLIPFNLINKNWYKI